MSIRAIRALIGQMPNVSSVNRIYSVRNLSAARLWDSNLPFLKRVGLSKSGLLPSAYCVKHLYPESFVISSLPSDEIVGHRNVLLQNIYPLPDGFIRKYLLGLSSDLSRSVQVSVHAPLWDAQISILKDLGLSNKWICRRDAWAILDESSCAELRKILSQAGIESTASKGGFLISVPREIFGSLRERLAIQRVLESAIEKGFPVHIRIAK